MNLTISDIAKLANVSKSAVSIVLNNREKNNLYNYRDYDNIKSKLANKIFNWQNETQDKFYSSNSV